MGMAFFLRRETDPDAPARLLARGRSIDGWGAAGNCLRCHAEDRLVHVAGWGEDEVEAMAADELADELETWLLRHGDRSIEETPELARADGRARCGHPGPALTVYLPGVCSLVEVEPDDAALTPAEVVALYPECREYTHPGPFLALYEGEEVDGVVDTESAAD